MEQATVHDQVPGGVFDTEVYTNKTKNQKSLEPSCFFSSHCEWKHFQAAEEVIWAYKTKIIRRLFGPGFLVPNYFCFIKKTLEKLVPKNLLGKI